MGSVKTGGYFMNQCYEDDKQESMQQKQITNHAEKPTGHANPAQRSNRTLLALVIIVCLISLVILLFTLLMFGKVGDGCDCTTNEASSQVSSTSAKSLAMDSAEIKALGENMTSFQVALMKNIDSAFTELTSHLTKTSNDLAELDNTLGKMENLDSAFTELTSRLAKTNEDLAELNDTLREMKNIDSAFTELTSHLTKTSKDLADLDNTLRKMENLSSAFTELTSRLAETNEDLAELNDTLRKFPGFKAPTRTSPARTRASLIKRTWRAILHACVLQVSMENFVGKLRSHARSSMMHTISLQVGWLRSTLAWHQLPFSVTWEILDVEMGHGQQS